MAIGYALRVDRLGGLLGAFLQRLPPVPDIVFYGLSPACFCRSRGNSARSVPTASPTRPTSGKKSRKESAEMLMPIEGKKTAKETAAKKSSAKQHKSA